MGLRHSQPGGAADWWSKQQFGTYAQTVVLFLDSVDVDMQGQPTIFGGPPKEIVFGPPATKKPVSAVGGGGW